MTLETKAAGSHGSSSWRCLQQRVSSRRAKEPDRTPGQAFRDGKNYNFRSSCGYEGDNRNKSTPTHFKNEVKSTNSEKGNTFDGSGGKNKAVNAVTGVDGLESEMKILPAKGAPRPGL